MMPAREDPVMPELSEDQGFVVFDDASFDAHEMGFGHPECPPRLASLRASFAPRAWPLRRPRPATREALERVHDPDFVDAILSCEGRYVQLDPDTSTSPGSVAAALHAAGAALEAAERLARGQPSFVACRPPGHHATPNRAMGFCFFNNAAIAAAHLAAGGLRVAIFDPDCHHGNGTQDAFFERGDILYASMHRFPFFPGTGRISEVGTGRGFGANLNVPMPGGADDAWYLPAFHALVLPLFERFAPDVCVLSAGFDAVDGDWLGGMRLSREGYASMVGEIARRWPTMATLEGGYNLELLGDDALATADVLAGGEVPRVEVTPMARWAQALREWEHPGLKR
jgi:acetoin utilization deacetylase AcuC-like enzyme